MKPVRLEIEGINSFSERQTIDFRPLIDAGLFGIFGNTGSGKSTILDCIMLALYGRSEKGQKGDFVNIKKLKGRVLFAFDVKENGSDVRYEVVREFPLKDDREAKIASAVLYREENRVKREIEDGMTRVSERLYNVIGLNYEDFKKCIVLPQGEIDRFVKSARRERLEIVGRLFSLDRYGIRLQERVQIRWAVAQRSLEQAEAEYRVFEEYQVDIMQKMEAELASSEERKVRLERELLELKNCVAKEEEIAALQTELEDALAKIEEFEKAKPVVERRKEKISRAETAKKIIEADSVVLTFQEELEKLESELKNNDKLLKSSNQIMLDIIDSDSYNGYQSELDRLTDQMSAAKALIETERQITEKEKLLNETEKKTAQYQSSLTETKKRLEELTKKIEELQAELKSFEENDLFFALEHAIEKATLTTESERWRSYFNEKLFLIKQYEPSLFREDAEREVENVIRSLDEKLIDQTDGKTDTLEMKKALYTSIEKEKKRAEEHTKTEKRLATLISDRSLKEKEIQVTNERLAEIMRSADSLRNVLTGERERLSVFGNGKSISEIVKETERKKELLVKKKESWEETIRKNRELISELRAKKATLEERKIYFIKNIEENREIVKQNMEKCGIISITQAKESFLTEEQISHYLHELEQYEQRFSFWREKYGIVKEKIGDRKVDVATLEKRRARLEELQRELRETDAAIVAGKIKSEDYRGKLKKKKELEKKCAEIRKSFGLIDQLSSLVKKQSLMEFVADEYLREIAQSASGTLAELTLGRYSLDYEKEFFIADNLNGGMPRGVNTLSGGEVFLVSLSLAVALSEAICERSKTPIEFFFLDEGFGALDGTLVEIVMDSLEKLKNTHFSIGLISHVAELKHRINAKILVEGASEEKGSVISLSI